MDACPTCLARLEARRARDRAYRERKTAERQARAPQAFDVVRVDLLTLVEDMLRAEAAVRAQARAFFN